MERKALGQELLQQACDGQVVSGEQLWVAGDVEEGEMPTISVNGAVLTYDILGEGPPVVLTSSGFKGMEYMRPLAEALSSQRKVLIYDRRNCGASDILIQDTPSELHLWAADLHALLHSLDMSPAYVGGASGGAAVSLLVAHLYPEDVRGLLLLLVPTDDPELLTRIVHARYLASAELAESKGMQAVVESDGWLQQVRQNADARDYLLSMNAHEFARVMRQWAAYVTSGRFPYLAADEALQRTDVPAIIIPGLDEFHPLHTCEKLYALLPHAELVVPNDWFTPDQVAQFATWYHKDGNSHERYNAALAPLLEGFMKRVEARD